MTDTNNGNLTMKLCHICYSYKDKVFDLMGNPGNNHLEYLGNECEDCRNNRLQGEKRRKKQVLEKLMREAPNTSEEM